MVVDTDIVIDYFNGTSPQAEIVEDLFLSQSLGLTSITFFELLAGVTGKKRINDIELFLTQSIFIPLDAKAARESARIYTRLKESGSLIGNQDILIAGICIANKLPLLTRNLNHFTKVPHLHLHLYQPKPTSHFSGEK